LVTNERDAITADMQVIFIVWLRDANA
jgi:hypothetical protein